MDSYVTNTKIRDADSFFVNFNFEVLYGCSHACKGCLVERTKQKGMPSQDALRFHRLLDDFNNSLYKPFIAFIGPTDFLVSENTVDFLTDPNIIKMLNKFKRLSFLTTYLDVTFQDKIIEVLNDYYPDKQMEINVLIEPEKVEDDNYIETLLRHKQYFESKLIHNNIRCFALFNTYNYSSTNASHLITDYNIMHKKIGHIFDTTIDFIFGFGRRHTTGLDVVKEQIYTISDMFNDSINEESAKYLRFSIGKLTDSLVERQYNYRNGKIYYSPLLYERFVGFDSRLEIPMTTWTVHDFEIFEESNVVNQYANIHNKECATCPYVASCVDRGIPTLMDVYDIKDCVLAKKALDVINKGSL